jgi:hypothetical protein
MPKKKKKKKRAIRILDARPIVVVTTRGPSGLPAGWWQVRRVIKILIELYGPSGRPTPSDLKPKTRCYRKVKEIYEPRHGRTVSDNTIDAAIKHVTDQSSDDSSSS